MPLPGARGRGDGAGGHVGVCIPGGRPGGKLAGALEAGRGAGREGRALCPAPRPGPHLLSSSSTTGFSSLRGL